ncbi:MAG: class IV adenylate cyclase [Bacteroidota bacterium]
MPQNLELKARISSMSEAVRAARSLHMCSKGILHQRDVYYNVPHGRLKLRIINTCAAELIYYNRPDKKGHRYSDYCVLPVSNPKLTNALCTAAFSQKVVVEKKRRLYLYKNARIHLDDVRGLGAFIEFEVLVKYGKRQAQTLLKFLSAQFEIKRSATVAVSYSDLLRRAR